MAGEEGPEFIFSGQEVGPDTDEYLVQVFGDVIEFASRTDRHERWSYPKTLTRFKDREIHEGRDERPMTEVVVPDGDLTFKMEITVRGAAFTDESGGGDDEDAQRQELADILRRLRIKVTESAHPTQQSFVLLDTYGNRVGTAWFEGEGCGASTVAARRGW